MPRERHRAVYICVPNGLHRQLTMRALDAGQARAVREAVQRRPKRSRRRSGAADGVGLVLCEAFMWRHNPQTQLLRDALTEIGAVEAMHASIRLSAGVDQTDHRLDGRRRRLVDGRRLLLRQRDRA